MRKLLLLIFSVLFMQVAAQQDSAGYVKYTPKFKFKEGIFLNFDQVKTNNPVPATRIVTSIAYDNPDFFDIVLQEDEFMIFEDIGTRREIKTDAIWGFSRNGFLYIRINGGFYRITIIGNICHFVANLTTYYNSYYNDPYAYSSYPYYSYPYNSYYSTYPATRNTEVRQYLLNFRTGSVMEYEVKSVEILLMADPELHDEYVNLSRKKKKQLKYMYIRKYNERNPLYFPER